MYDCRSIVTASVCARAIVVIKVSMASFKSTCCIKSVSFKHMVRNVAYLFCGVSKVGVQLVQVFDTSGILDVDLILSSFRIWMSK